MEGWYFTLNLQIEERGVSKWGLGWFHSRSFNFESFQWLGEDAGDVTLLRSME